MVLKPSIRISKIRARIPGFDVTAPGFDVTAPGFDVTAHGYGYWLMDTGTGSWIRVLAWSMGQEQGSRVHHGPRVHHDQCVRHATRDS